MKRILIVFLACLLISCSGSKPEKSSNQPEYPVELNLSAADSLKLTKVWQVAIQESWHQKSLAEIEIQVGELFLEMPYVAGTLDKDTVEKLVINLQEFDCVTFVEQVIALTLTIKSGELNYSNFAENLENLRYRNGKLDGYASRLHYFSDWLTDNQQKGFINLLSDGLGDAVLDTKVDIISQNWNSNQFAADSKLLAEIKAVEAAVSKSNLKYLSKQRLEVVENQIQAGDIIAITTSIKGLDVAHTGIAVHVNGRLHLFHASSTLGEVVISDVPLSEYLQAKKSFSGVLVARLIH